MTADAGPIQYDTLALVMSWVEKGMAPNVLMTTYLEGSVNGAGRGGRGGRGVTQPGAPAAPPKIVRTRPVYPYPLVAHYKGTGSIDDAANFAPQMPSTALPEQFKWMGSSFFSAHYERWCGWNGMTFSCSGERR